MHAHFLATPERTLAPSQMLRGVAGACVAVAGTPAPSITRSRSLRSASRRLDSWYPCPGTGADGVDSEVDFGNLVGGGPV